MHWWWWWWGDKCFEWILRFAMRYQVRKMMLLGMGAPSSISISCFFHTRLPTTPTPQFYLNFKPSLSNSITNMALTTKASENLPILLFDIMDTIVRDPFYEDVPAFFGMSLKELIDCKHPTAWVEFEKGFIDEVKQTANLYKAQHF